MRPFCFSLIACFAACAGAPARAVDPFFVRAWSEDSANRELQTREDYLKWVDSFYAGSVLIPGWSSRQAELRAGLDPEDAPLAESRLDLLGRLLASEWSKDNRVRRVDSDDLCRFAGILTEAREAGRLIAAVDGLLEEVESVVPGDIQTSRR